ncbi:hypothetical protein [Pseudomonas oryzihabitans]|uniref:hypothetical protein n=1 Tax=Pseudomonas oryzihabitans TaxID=47885 RepID=UPI001ABFF1CF|nr:hypothetical protein [Pseudomonas oryzihabitans]
MIYTTEPPCEHACHPHDVAALDYEQLWMEFHYGSYGHCPLLQLYAERRLERLALEI